MTTPPIGTERAQAYETVIDGVELRFVRHHADRGTTFFVRMKRGARAPRHGHPGGEETCVLSGTLRIEGRVDKAGIAQPDLVVSAGEYAFAPAGETHEGVALDDTVFFVVAAGGIVAARSSASDEAPTEVSAPPAQLRR